MKINTDFEIVEMAGEYMAVPVGKTATDKHEIVALSEPAAFLLNNLNSPKSREALLELLLDEYEIEKAIAEKDLDAFIEEMSQIGIII